VALGDPVTRRIAGRTRLASHGLALCLIAGSGATGQTAGGTGTIEGQVVYEGEAPPPTIVMEAGSTQHVLYVDATGGLRYAIAFLSDARAGGGAEPEAATLHQSGFIFEPQVLAIREGQAVHFTNDDGSNHNVRSQDEDPSNRFSLYTGAGQSHTHRFRDGRGDRPVVITCEIHPWMIAWIYVLSHPHFAVTDAAGRFRIAGVPAGSYRLSVRQPAGGLRRDVGVRVAPGEVARVNVRFTSSELRLPRGIPAADARAGGSRVSFRLAPPAPGGLRVVPPRAVRAIGIEPGIELDGGSSGP
jgi:plastocyanin